MLYHLYINYAILSNMNHHINSTISSYSYLQLFVFKKLYFLMLCWHSNLMAVPQITEYSHLQLIIISLGLKTLSFSHYKSLNKSYIIPSIIFLKASFTLCPVFAEVYIYKTLPLYYIKKCYTLFMLTYRFYRSFLFPIRSTTVYFLVFYSAYLIHLVTL